MYLGTSVLNKLEGGDITYFYSILAQRSIYEYSWKKRARFNSTSNAVSVMIE